MLDEMPSRDAASLRTAHRLSVTVPLFAPTALFPPLTMALNVWWAWSASARAAHRRRREEDRPPGLPAGSARRWMADHSGGQYLSSATRLIKASSESDEAAGAVSRSSSPHPRSIWASTGSLGRDC